MTRRTYAGLGRGGHVATYVSPASLAVVGAFVFAGCGERPRPSESEIDPVQLTRELCESMAAGDASIAEACLKGAASAADLASGHNLCQPVAGGSATFTDECLREVTATATAPASTERP